MTALCDMTIVDVIGTNISRCLGYSMCWYGVNCSTTKIPGVDGEDPVGPLRSCRKSLGICKGQRHSFLLLRVLGTRNRDGLEVLAMYLL